VCPLGGCVCGAQTITQLLLQCGNAVLSDTRTRDYDRVVNVLRMLMDHHRGRNTRVAWGPTRVGEFWTSFDDDVPLKNLQPDGLVMDDDRKRIHILEVARQDVSEEDAGPLVGGWVSSELLHTLLELFLDFREVLVVLEEGEHVLKHNIAYGALDAVADVELLVALERVAVLPDLCGLEDPVDEYGG
jgi:hypothetical protein